MSEIVFLILLLILEIAGPIILVIFLVWGVVVLRRGWREKESFSASRGDETAMAMERLRIKAWGMRIVGAILWPVGFGFSLYLGANGQLAFMAASVISGGCFLWAGSIKNRYNTSFKENFVKSELAKVFENLQYVPDGKFDAASLQSLGFFKSIDRVSGNDLITADYKGIHFAQCDLGVQEMYTVTVKDSDGHTKREDRYRDIFRGRAMRFDFADIFRGKVQVVSRNFDGAEVKSPRGEWQVVETELAEFSGRFEVFAYDPLDAMAVLTPQMIEGIFYLGKALGVPMALYFIENTMVAFLSTGREAFDVSGKKTLLEERELLKRDIALITGFLDIMYFRRQETPAPAPAFREQTPEERAAAAAAVAAAAGPTEGEQIARQAKRVVGKTFSYLPHAIIAVFLVSAVYAMVALPDGISAGASYSDGQWQGSGMRVPTIGYLLVGGFFVIAAARTPFVAVLLLAIHLLFLAANIP